MREANPEKNLILNFAKTVQTLHETDIGDFKRKVISYLNRMESDINKNSLHPLFYQLKESLICNDTRDIEVLREQILHKIKKMKKGGYTDPA